MAFKSSIRTASRLPIPCVFPFPTFCLWSSSYYLCFQKKCDLKTKFWHQFFKQLVYDVYKSETSNPLYQLEYFGNNWLNQMSTVDYIQKGTHTHKHVPTHSTTYSSAHHKMAKLPHIKLKMKRSGSKSQREFISKLISPPEYEDLTSQPTKASQSKDWQA